MTGFLSICLTLVDGVSIDIGKIKVQPFSPHPFLSLSLSEMIFMKKIVVTGALFFLICLSLGYPSVSRYQPGPPQLSDVVQYADMVKLGAPAMEDGHWRYRVLVPYLAKPVLVLAEGRVGSWNAVSFALLVVNSGFCAATALLLARLVGGAVPGLIAALLFLVQFNVSNFYLSGLVDSAEVFFMTLTVFALRHRKWLALPVIALVGATARETFVPLMALMASGWFLGLPRQERRLNQILIIGVSALVGLLTVALLRLVVGGHMVWPWEIAATEGNFLTPLSYAGGLFGRALCYTFIWVAPLGLLGWKLLDRPWAMGSSVAFAGAFCLSTWANAGNNVGRPLFSAAGPFLVCAAALWLIRWLDVPAATSRMDPSASS